MVKGQVLKSETQNFLEGKKRILTSRKFDGTMTSRPFHGSVLGLHGDFFRLVPADRNQYQTQYKCSTKYACQSIHDWCLHQRL